MNYSILSKRVLQVFCLKALARTLHEILSEPNLSKFKSPQLIKFCAQFSKGQFVTLHILYIQKNFTLRALPEQCIACVIKGSR